MIRKLYQDRVEDLLRQIAHTLVAAKEASRTLDHPQWLECELEALRKEVNYFAGHRTWLEYQQEAEEDL